MTQKEAARELHDRVRQCVARHKFKTFGDILSWWHKTDFETRTMEAGEQGISKFSTEIMWLIGQFGPKTKIEHPKLDSKKIPILKPIKISKKN